ncbi:MAG: FkbM family methyltransferase [Planctomycetes bacterium]|nr:FkbM family methyltransferase [Planctomycetota bacterium]
MHLRQLRRQWTPAWLTTDARRRGRDIVLRRLGIQRCYTPPVLTREPELLVRSCLPFVVAHELLKNPDFTFLQIGAFDGVGDDDLRDLILRHGLRGVLVEPQPAAFEKLQMAYRDRPRIMLLRAAIADRVGVRSLFCQRGQASMAASFNREHLRRHGIPDDEIVAQPVVCHTVVSALQAAGLDRVDLIQIDAEGYDWPIIRSIDFARLRPAIVRFEYRHMTSHDSDACVNFLAAHGYRILPEPRDIIALRMAELGQQPAAREDECTAGQASSSTLRGRLAEKWTRPRPQDGVTAE